MSTVLIIEDETSMRANVAEYLTYEGFNVIEAENGLIGVQKAREYLPDVIICDVMMPELDGYGVLLQLRSDPATATIPFIFLTAKASRLAMRQGMELGADDYLTKPFLSQELISTVKTRLEKQALVAQEYRQKLDTLRDDLIMMLPHELRTPLTGIMGYSELLMSDGNDLKPSQVVKMGGVIYDASQRLYRLIENYLLYAQLEIVRSDEERTRLFQNQQIDHAKEIIIQTSVQQAHHVKREADLNIEVENAAIFISASNLQKIVQELVDNALKFSAAGTPVDIRGSVFEAVYVVQITDRGRGMTTEQVKNIGAYVQFERKLFEQQGLGLGLIITQRLVELHRGELIIESEPEQGTTVYVHLPLV